MIWEAYQQGKIAEAGLAAERAERRNENTAAALERLDRQLGRLTLACQSMWELLREHTPLTEEELNAKILEVDLRDGRADGKIGTSVLTCSNCGRNTNSKRSTCLICGAPVPRPHPFE